MKVKALFKYSGYATWRWVPELKEGETLDDQVQHEYSSSPTDPIVEIGLGPKFRVQEMEVPNWEWLVQVIARGQRDGRWWGLSPEKFAEKVVFNPVELTEKALRYLATRDEWSKYERSVAEWALDHGVVTPLQAARILRVKRW